MGLQTGFDTNFVSQRYNACHTLAAMDAKLPFVIRFHPSADGYDSPLGLDFDGAKSRKVLAIEEIDDSPFQFSIRMSHSTFSASHVVTSV